VAGFNTQGRQQTLAERAVRSGFSYCEAALRQLTKNLISALLTKSTVERDDGEYHPIKERDR
jgi:hypothetical protein